ncbi:MAG: ATP-binding protein, partial [Candidatus Paceibacterota bacterium]
MHFNPADIQATGVGLAAFLSLILMLFVFLSARQERLGRPMWITFAAAFVWSAFGFLYHIVPDLGLARDMRILSVMGIVLICMSEINFALVYLSDRVEPGRLARMARQFVLGGGTILNALLIADLFGTRFIVGELTLPTDVVLAPTAGPLMAVLIAYYIVSTATSGAFLAWSARVATDETSRRQALILFASMTVGLALGGTRFTPWYGFDFYPIVGDIGFPLFTFSLFYTIKRYHLLNLEVAAAQLFIFVLWTFTFFRLLLDPTWKDAIPDIGLFVAAVVLGILLLRSIVAEMRTQKQLAKMTLEREKTEFITIAAHQLRTPVSALRWSFNLLQENDENLNETQRSIVERGNSAADNMAHIIGDLLDMGSIASGKFIYVFAEGDVVDTIQTSANLFHDIATSRKISFEVRVPDTLNRIVYDAGKISLVVQNLIDNALKYTSAAGKVVVEAQNLGDGVRISISDTGIGFSSAEKERIFDKFFRGSRAM